MKERPILFSGAMVRGLLDGSKTQTRRVVKPWKGAEPSSKPVPADLQYLPDFTCYRETCPYGQTGDRLWAREAWRADIGFNDLPPRDIDESAAVYYEATEDNSAGHFKGKLRPSMFMPRWASRILLEITGVRVDRLQDISEADATAEGCEKRNNPDDDAYVAEATYRQGYRQLWESINGPGSWALNPWVWVVEFKVVKP